MGLLGVLWCILLALFFPNFLLQPDVRSLPPAVQLFAEIIWKAGTWPWGLITCVLLIIQIVRANYEKKAWAPAFVFGIVLGYMVVQAFRS